jgi:nitrite reductase/ring-hydroxylating ferredoxin subunit
MKHVEVDGREILIENVNGKFYAVNGRCGHTNARLICPLHAAQFDVTTRRKLAEPALGGHIAEMDKLPPSFLKTIEHSRKIIAEIRTFGLQTYELSVNEKSVQLKME